MSFEKSEKNQPATAITRIRIEKLFGQYSYDLEFTQVAGRCAPKVGIIYGDNGTGKTTILEILFHLLSPSGERKHRSSLARIPFLRFSVILSDKTEISAVRKHPHITGSYILRLVTPRKKVMQDKVKATQDGSVSYTSPTVERILKYIYSLQTPVFFLNDQRTLLSDQLPVRRFGQGTEEISFERLPSEVRQIRPDQRGLALDLSIARTAAWLRRRLIQVSAEGEAEAQQIYAHIVKTLKVPRTEGGNIERKRLVQSLKELELRSHLFSKYGLTLKIKVAPLIRSLKASHRKVLPFAAQVVSSFIEGQRARLDSLEKFNDLLNRFVGLINGFLVDKRIILNVDSGIRILKNSGLALEPEKLSSGEKQLLLLFCSALTVTDRMSLFLIDEPEISLNVKWQRRLIDSLSDITKDSQCQFLLATHSIELLTKHKIHTIKLKPSKIRKEHG